MIIKLNDHQAEGFVRRGKFTKSPAIDLPKKNSRISIHLIPYIA